MAIYPNPVKNLLTIVSPYILQNAQIKITNTMGQTIITKLGSIDEHTRINTEQLVKGFYLLQVIKNGKIIYQDKFIKQGY
jgi:hypothetical protein